jgi:hypothetical protein
MIYLNITRIGTAKKSTVIISVSLLDSAILSAHQRTKRLKGLRSGRKMRAPATFIVR